MMDNKTLSDLIGLIYDAAFNAELWPRLLEVMSNEMGALLLEEEKTDLEEDKKKATPTYALIDLLRSHFTRALELNRQVFEAHEERDAIGELLERLPLGIVVVDSESHILTYNKKLAQIASDGQGISIKNSLLSTGSSLDTKKLRKMIRNVTCNAGQEVQSISFLPENANMPLSALVVPFNAMSNSGVNNGKKAVVFIASPEMHIEISADILKSLYKLTTAEAKLVSLLVKDHSLNAIAEQLGLSKHTIRAQLKSVYEKTGAHRQAELVRQIITGPAMLATLTSEINSAAELSTGSVSVLRPIGFASQLHQTMRLPDDRILGYAEYGVKTDFPVMLMHSSFGSRFQRHPDEKIISKCGVRLIIPDRPGTGLSDKKENRTLLDWAYDVACLADHLGLKHFNVIGHSMGGAFGLACAHVLKERIGRLVLVGSVLPFIKFKDLGGMQPHFRLLLCLGRYAPSLFSPLMRLLFSRLGPEMIQSEFSKEMPPLDCALLYDREIRSRIDEDIRESLRQGGQHILPEFFLISGDWKFGLEEIQVPVEIWHGQMDPIVPFHFANKMEELLPHCQTNYLPGVGGYILYHCWREILLSAVSTDN
ncbi:MAG: alpha/beta fold hydrolase [Myxococcota bacterium]|nr:alpha/beta fold hydrolase [Myxococcota bacterium]